MKNPYEVILAPMLTEKSSGNIEHLNQYTFRVAAKSNKVEIKRAIESIFEVKVVGVRTRWKPAKRKRIGMSQGFKSGWKEAVVQLRTGEKIDVY